MRRGCDRGGGYPMELPDLAALNHAGGMRFGLFPMFDREGGSVGDELGDEGGTRVATHSLPQFPPSNVPVSDA